MEGLMAFFMEATFIGLWFFGWERLSKRAHLMVGWLMAIATNFSALWILIANGWMQYPVGGRFNPITMRMELTSFTVALNPVAQAKFVHTVSAGYVCGSVSCWGLGVVSAQGRHIQLARRSIAVASAFGLAGILSVIVLGDESGYDARRKPEDEDGRDRGHVETEPAPASFTPFGFPDQATHETKCHPYPYVMGLIGTRSLTQEILASTSLWRGARPAQWHHGP